MEDLDFSRLDVALAIYDANDDPREAELLCGVALRKDDLEAFLHDLCELAERKYGGMRFARLLDEDEDDEASVEVGFLEPRYRGGRALS